VCGKTDENQRVERGLYVCDEHDDAFNADVNGAENIRLDITASNSESGDEELSTDGTNQPSGGEPSEDRSTGWLAQPSVYLHDLSCGFQPQREVVDCRP